MSKDWVIYTSEDFNSDVDWLVGFGIEKRDAEEFIMNLTERVKQAGVEDDLDRNNENE